MGDREDYRGYIVWVAVALLAANLSAAAVNLIVDPYGMFGSPRLEGLNAHKPALSKRILFVKGYLADRVGARSLIAGNSRPEMGLDPASPCWLPDELPVFNTGVPGAILEQQIQFVEHAAQTSDVRRVFLGLDLIDFLVDPASDPHRPRPALSTTAPSPNLRVATDGGQNPRYRWRRIQDWFTAAFSLETLADSITTLLRQRSQGIADRRPDGFNPAENYGPIIRSEGQSVLFVQKDAEVLRAFSRPNLAVHQGGQRWSSKLEALDRFLDRAAGLGIEIVLFINPYHGDYLSILALTGHWDLLADWKQSLTHLADSRGVVLWDLNAISPRTTEPPPPAGDRSSTLAWFWEPAHYRREYGELMLATMLERDCAPDERPVGVRLTPASVTSHLADQRAAIDAFLRAHPEVRVRLGLQGG